MIALTIRQPWAWFIVNGYKDIENRTWKPRQDRIGERFVIHASQRRLTKDDFENFLSIVRELKIKKYPRSIDEFTYGALVGTAVIESVSRSSKSYWAVKNHYHWLLTRPRKLKPKRKKGRLGFFEV